MIDLNSLNIKIFLDTANLDTIKSSINQYPFIKGFTTNPSLMHKEGIKDYEAYCKKALEVSSNLPILCVAIKSSLYFDLNNCFHCFFLFFDKQICTGIC